MSILAQVEALTLTGEQPGEVRVQFRLVGLQAGVGPCAFLYRAGAGPEVELTRTRAAADAIEAFAADRTPGALHQITWDSANDLGLVLANDLVVIVRPLTAGGLSGESAPVRIDNRPSTQRNVMRTGAPLAAVAAVDPEQLVAGVALDVCVLTGTGFLGLADRLFALVLTGVSRHVYGRDKVHIVSDTVINAVGLTVLFPGTYAVDLVDADLVVLASTSIVAVRS